MTVRETKILARVIKIQKENWGVTTHSSEIIKPQFEKKKKKSHTMLHILVLLTFIVA